MTYPGAARMIAIQFMFEQGVSHDTLVYVSSLIPGSPTLQTLKNWWQEFLEFSVVEPSLKRAAKAEPVVAEQYINYCCFLLAHDSTLTYAELAECLFIQFGVVFTARQLSGRLHSLGYRQKVVEYDTRHCSAYLRQLWYDSVFGNLDVLPASS